MMTIRVYRAIDEKDTCLKYMEGHVKVLHDYGIVNVTSNNPLWPENPHVYCVVAYDEEGEMVGGIRVQIANGIYPLPVEIAVGENDPRIYDFVRAVAINGGIGELSGLWNSKKVKGLGISYLLTRSGVAITNQTGAQTLTGICGGYTLDMFTRVGFVTNEALGDNGEFMYPNKDNIAKVIGILNSVSLETAHPEEKEEILRLRNNPQQILSRQGTQENLEIRYDLVIPNVSPINLPEEYVKGKIQL
jgi:hypothetical protein